MPPQLLLATAAILPFLGSLVAICLPRQARNVAASVAGGVTLVSLACIGLLYPAIAHGGPVTWVVEWLPTLGVRFVLRLDGLSWLFAMLVLGIGALVVLYARYYMAAADPVPRLFCYFLAFVGAMLGIVLSGNLIQLVVFWELTSIVSFLLIGYWSDNASARDGARMSLTITAAGGLCLLVGAVFLGRIAGSYDLDAVLAAGDAIRASPLYTPALILILAGALTKSAQFPFHIWLPRAMAAPTPISAYLHSATMVKAGIFLVIRLFPVLSGTDEWYWIVGSAGMATMLVGAWSAIFQHDLKGLLAYSTISHLGLITLLLGLDTPLAVVAAIFHTVNHATFKASLFMAAGIIDHETGTRDMRRLSGLWRAMPYTGTLAMVAAAAMAGVPLLNGFLSKEMFLAEAADNAGGHQLNLALPFLATLASAFTVLYSLRFIRQTFFGPAPHDLPHAPHEPVRWMRIPIELLVLACIAIGLVPNLTIGPVLAGAARTVLGARMPDYDLAIWHGFNAPLVMSILALVGGVALYGMFGRRINTNPRGGPWLMDRLDGGWLFERGMTGLVRAARALEAQFGAERLQPQLRILFLAALLAAIAAGVARGLDLFAPGRVTDFDPAFALMWLVGAACAVGAAERAKYHRLSAAIFVGGAGLVSSLTFLWLSAPDLAVTQILVEIVTTVLLLLGLRWLPKRDEAIPAPASEKARARRRRLVDLGIAIFAGFGLAGLAYAVMTRPAVDGISRWFVEEAYPQAGGRNVVNVLLVDFRAFDTMGEICVLGIVGLTVFALLRRFRPAPDSLERPAQQLRHDAYDRAREGREPGHTTADALLVPRMVMTWLFPFIVLLALHLFLRGHDLPGGGFAAGIALTVAFILQYMACGAQWVEERLRIQPIAWIGVGLLVAVLAGAASWLFGRPFLTAYFAYWELPLIGKVPVASALLFDLGIMVLVVGASALMLVALAHQSLRRTRATEAEMERAASKEHA
ncbi:monovalent cation/H+ antiporter subunit A [Methylobacterium organophilum]|uniref:NAD(P)H-quinone oxidoreductase subunit 2, chloroplastic n=1 Tax=Methylobacterium organophilum TaxID=410 RepID=A0ABQ4T867_METOR|nr:monovalent cation/H+ antiporter subunit A [Methylobacterium organophilum]GJE27813.1 NAD(P)H-quinone oxidoreductase subunit 2, chloroplastic [Methylobacterium organophilum]